MNNDLESVLLFKLRANYRGWQPSKSVFSESIDKNPKEVYCIGRCIIWALNIYLIGTWL